MKCPSFTKNKHLLQSHGMIAGINYGYLKNAREINGNGATDISASYHDSDFGIKLGYGYELLAFKNLLLSGSVNTNFGLKNIYSGTDFIPANFNRTHTAAIGFQLGIKYLIR